MKTLLIVDDDDYLRFSLGRLLGIDYAVRTAASGLEALALVEAYPIDVAIIDLMMPEMDGETLVEELRGRGHHFPILMVSAMTDVERVAARWPPSDFAIKPAFADVLRKKLDALLSSPTL